MFAITNILLSVEQPLRDLVLERILHNHDDPLKLVRVELASTSKSPVPDQNDETLVQMTAANVPLLEIDVGLLADNI